MPLLRTEEHEGLVCKFYDGGVVMVGTTAADRFTVRLKDGDDFATRLKEKLKERCAATEPEHKARELYCKRPNAKEELAAISAKNQKIDAERRAAKQASTQRNAEDRRGARTANPCLCTKEGATERLRQTQDMLHDSMQQTREAQQVAKGALKSTSMLVEWLKRGSQSA
jgi:hypothetical protein